MNLFIEDAPEGHRIIITAEGVWVEPLEDVEPPAVREPKTTSPFLEVHTPTAQMSP